jgi:hypothetical protein
VGGADQAERGSLSTLLRGIAASLDAGSVGVPRKPPLGRPRAGRAIPGRLRADLTQAAGPASGDGDSPSLSARISEASLYWRLLDCARAAQPATAAASNGQALSEQEASYAASTPPYWGTAAAGEVCICGHLLFGPRCCGGPAVAGAAVLTQGVARERGAAPFAPGRFHPRPDRGCVEPNRATPGPRHLLWSGLLVQYSIATRIVVNRVGRAGIPVGKTPCALARKTCLSTTRGRKGEFAPSRAPPEAVSGVLGTACGRRCHRMGHARKLC